MYGALTNEIDKRSSFSYERRIFPPLLALYRVAETGLQSALLDNSNDFSISHPQVVIIGHQFPNTVAWTSSCGIHRETFSLFGNRWKPNKDGLWSLALFRFWGSGTMCSVQHGWCWQYFFTLDLCNSCRKKSVGHGPSIDSGRPIMQTLLR